MIVKKETYTYDEVIQLLKWQHVVTRDACLTSFQGEYDYHEWVQVREIITRCQQMLFDKTRIDTSESYYGFE